MNTRTASVIATAVLLILATPARAQTDEMFDWATMSKSVMEAAQVYKTEEDWKAASGSTYAATKATALEQVAERCPTIIGNLPEDARPGLLVDFDAFCECYDDELVNVSVAAMFTSNRMGVDGKTMTERREAWEKLFDIPHEQRLGGCVIKTTELQ